MPFGDGTGPLGQGPRTGRGAGFCSGFGVPGSLNRGGGFFGRGRGGGRGWRNWQGAFGWPFGSPAQYDEVGALKAQAGFFERALDSIRKRIEGLETKTKAE
ncbi:MAG: DUF5320 domain-containing protein [Bryobacteraceae bacterium]